MTAGERFLVTGALGCIGAWTVRSLAEEGTPVVAFDQAADTRRLRDISTPQQYAANTADFFRDQIARGTFSAEKHGLEPLAAGALPKA
jgi:nucleoside-diphosphate-sugar epimerase